MSNKFAVGSLISVGVSSVFFMASFATGIFALGSIFDTEQDVWDKINALIGFISVVGSVISVITAFVLAIMGLKKSKQLNGQGKTLSIVALSLVSMSVFIFFTVLIFILIS
ncbi:MAG: hypothetical protein OXF49_03500 [Candidatus Saccharibacteria bacterium]|nr:hypothetical protein [Candidatus Saccharibacteria bacterium]